MTGLTQMPISTEDIVQVPVAYPGFHFRV